MNQTWLICQRGKEWRLKTKNPSVFSHPVRRCDQLSITMGTARQAVTTPRMSSTLGSTAGCALTTRRWRSSASTRCWSRLQSAPPTCFTTAVSTCCRRTRTSRHSHTGTPEYIHKRTSTYMLKMHLMTSEYISTWHEHTHSNEQEHCPTCSLARFSSSSLLSPCFPDNQLFQRLLLVSFWKKRNNLHSQRVPVIALSSLCTTAVSFLFFSFGVFGPFCFTFKATRKDCWLDRGGGWGGRGGGVTGSDPRLTSGWAQSLAPIANSSLTHTGKTIYHRLQVDCWGNTSELPC